MFSSCCYDVQFHALCLNTAFFFLLLFASPSFLPPLPFLLSFQPIRTRAAEGSCTVRTITARTENTDNITQRCSSGDLSFSFSFSTLRCPSAIGPTPLSSRPAARACLARADFGCACLGGLAPPALSRRSMTRALQRGGDTGRGGEGGREGEERERRQRLPHILPTQSEAGGIGCSEGLGSASKRRVVGDEGHTNMQAVHMQHRKTLRQ